jgi:hypothetical protein
MVASHAGVTQSAITSIFASEQECVLAAVDEGLARLSQTVDEAVAPKRSWLDRLRAGLVAFLGFLDDEPAWGRLLVLEPPVEDLARTAASAGCSDRSARRRRRAGGAGVPARADVDTGTKEGKNLVVKFKGCKVTPFVCTSPGHEEGELETYPLEGKAVWENEKEHKTALDLYPSVGHETFIEFTCGKNAEVTVKVKGSVLVPIKPDKMASTFTLKFKAKNGFQVPQEYEESGKKVKDVLFSDFTEKGYDQAGQTETVTVKNEEKLELNAYV